MDPFTLAYYATVCAVLGAIAPAIRGIVTRLIIGAMVGVGAVALLPVVRPILGL